MTVAELQEAKRLKTPVILKACPPRNYADIEYKSVLAVTIRRINGKSKPVAVLEDYCGHSVTYADPSHIEKR
jgi:hypothetical protein